MPLLMDQWDVTKYLPDERLSDCQEYTLQKLRSNLKDSEFSTDGWNSHMQSECLETKSYRIHIYPYNTNRISLKSTKRSEEIRIDVRSSMCYSCQIN